MRAAYKVTVTRPPTTATRGTDIVLEVIGRIRGSVVDSLPGLAWRAARRVMKERLASIYAWRHIRLDLWRED